MTNQYKNTPNNNIIEYSYDDLIFNFYTSK
jgi:hypothetical protein